MGQAYSIHTFSGMLGIAAAPGSVLLMHSLFGWRGASSARPSWVVTAVMLLQRDATRTTPPPSPRQAAARTTSWRLLLARRSWSSSCSS